MRSASNVLLLAAAHAAAFAPGSIPRLLRRPTMSLNTFITMEATTTSSGLAYEVLREGNGDSPTKNQIVKVNYKGTLKDGTVFDSSYDRGEPTEFQVNQVIQVWQEGLALMKAGGKAKLVIPAELAYGSSQMGSIPPNSELTFEVELLEVKGSTVPDDYLGRSFASASMKPREKNEKEPFEGRYDPDSALPDPIWLGAIALIGVAGYFGLIPN